jgi:hypothetical protein
LDCMTYIFRPALRHDECGRSHFPIALDGGPSFQLSAWSLFLPFVFASRRLTPA